MNDAELKQMLQTTLADSRLSRAERHALSEVLNTLCTTAEKTRHVQQLAFATAQEHLYDPRDHAVLQWLKDIHKLLHNGLVKDQAIAEVFFSPSHECVDAICKHLNRAQHSVDICVFTITDDRISRTIADAHQRSVRIRIISDDAKSYEPGSDVADLVRRGIAVRYDSSEHHMHHKFALFDGKLVVTGSYNWTRSAAAYNNENLIVSNETAFVLGFHEEFERLWTQFSAS